MEYIEITKMVLPDTDFHLPDIGTFPYTKGDWGVWLKDRDDITIRNQGINNDNSSATTLEIYFKQPIITYSDYLRLYYKSETNTWYLTSHSFVPQVNDRLINNSKDIEALITSVVQNGDTFEFTLEGVENLNTDASSTVSIVHYEFEPPVIGDPNIKLNTSENFSMNASSDIIVWLRGAVVNTTAIILQTK